MEVAEWWNALPDQDSGGLGDPGIMGSGEDDDVKPNNPDPDMVNTMVKEEAPSDGYPESQPGEHKSIHPTTINRDYLAPQFAV